MFHRHTVHAARTRYILQCEWCGERFGNIDSAAAHGHTNAFGVEQDLRFEIFECNCITCIESGRK